MTRTTVFISTLSIIVLLTLRSTMIFASYAPLSGMEYAELDTLASTGVADTSVYDKAKVWVPQVESDLDRMKRRFTHFIAAEASFGRVALGQSSFMRGDNSKGTAITNQSLYAVKYGFQARRGTSQSILYGAPYQGLGFFSSTFHHPQDLGTPWGLYLFQGARIAIITPRLSFNYEWKFGMSGGWHHYSYPDNPANDIIGSPLNAYINTTFYINYIISKHWGVSAGISATHYSNGNTRTPNRGINVLSGTIGMRYYFNRDFDRYFSPRNIITRPPFMRSMSYEIMGYASWKDAILDTSNTPVENPYLNKKLLVAGFSFSPMYVLGRKVRVGGSLDFSYDKSRGLSYEHTRYGIKYVPAAPRDRMALGLSAKVDFVMPYFTITGSLGYDIIEGAGNMPPTYQIIALRFDLSSHFFFSIGYKARQFQYPDNLMWGMGFRFGRGTRYQL